MTAVAVRRMAVAGLVAGIVAAGGRSLHAQAAPAAPTKLGYVDTRAILQATPGYAKAESTFARTLEGYRTEVTRLQTALDSAAADFEQSSVMLSPTQRAAKRKELEGQQETLQKRTAELQQRADSVQGSLLQPIRQRINAAIEGLRTEGSYAFIFDVSNPNSGILTADRSLDLTQRVIQRLQAAKN